MRRMWFSSEQPAKPSGQRAVDVRKSSASLRRNGSMMSMTANAAFNWGWR